MITHLGCWKNTQNVCQSNAFGSWFTSFSRVLPTSRLGYHAGKPIESVVYCLNIYMGKLISPGTNQSMEHVLFSSGIDGIVARQLNQTSAFGAWVWNSWVLQKVYSQINMAKIILAVYTVEPPFNKPLYNKVLGKRNNFPYSRNSKIYEKETRYTTKPQYSGQIYKFCQSLSPSLFWSSTVYVYMPLFIFCSGYTVNENRAVGFSSLSFPFYSGTSI